MSFTGAFTRHWLLGGRLTDSFDSLGDKATISLEGNFGVQSVPINFHAPIENILNKNLNANAQRHHPSDVE